MKRCVVLLIVAITAMTAEASVFVDWRASGGFYWSADESGILPTVGSSVLAQLIWSPDAAASDADLSAVNYLSEGEALLNQVVLTRGVNVQNEWAYWTAAIQSDDGGANPVGGFIYGRIFESSAPQLDDWYYVGAVIPASNLDTSVEPIPLAQEYQMSRDQVWGDAIDGEFGRQVVPEPASISLLVLGAAVLGLRRRRR